VLIRLLAGDHFLLPPAEAIAWFIHAGFDELIFGGVGELRT